MNRIEITLIKSAIKLIERKMARNTQRLKQLSNYRVTVMRRVETKDRIYYQYKGQDGKFKYLGVESNRAVQFTKESRFLEELNARYAGNLKLLKSVIEHYRPTDKASVNEALPASYRGCAKFPDPEQIRARRIAEWKAEKAKIKESYPIKNPEQLVIPFRDGIMMRSKSEVIDAILLDDYGLPFMYEVPVKIDGHVIYPDFVILDPFDLQTEYLLEHFGRMDLENYQDEVGFKMAKYMKIGYMPWNNFYMTFDRIDGSGIDLVPFYDMIDKIYAPRDKDSRPKYGILEPTAAMAVPKRKAG